MAAANGHDAVVQCLLQHGASINHSDNQLGYTALHYAASQARAALVPLLVQHGADGECSSLCRVLARPSSTAMPSPMQCKLLCHAPRAV
eukprot:COSAG02_NODE_6124_length_3784_cov_1.813297_4_plen_89_part_00